jgi:diguanylate cyclase (GGDEF)-like protein
VIDCSVRDLSDAGACLVAENTVGVPACFELLFERERTGRPCRVTWRSDNRIGISFDRRWGSQAAGRGEETQSSSTTPSRSSYVAGEGGHTELVRMDLLRLRAALDEVPFGVVLLDHELRAQFINRAFRIMWRLPDTKAESKPPFVALMYHGRDTRAYDVPADRLDDYIAERVAHVKGNNPEPIDLRLASGEVIRFQATALPAGGRMLSYTYVTDIVRRSDEMQVLFAAFDNVEQGVVLLDSVLRCQFINCAARRLCNVSDEQAERRLSYAELVSNSPLKAIYGGPSDESQSFLEKRLAQVRAGDASPVELTSADGRIVRAQCAVLPDGGYMMTYTDVTDLVRRAERLEVLAITDGMTDLYNRRHFLVLANAEWHRFQRHHHPLSLLILDIDQFKCINDTFGHDVGDQAIMRVTDLCRKVWRRSDIVGRIGGDEFALLLPQTDLEQARILAERLRQEVAGHSQRSNGVDIPLTVSIGIAEAYLGMSGIEALMKASDEALYRAKSAGRNRVGLWHGGPAPESKIAAE